MAPASRNRSRAPIPRRSREGLLFSEPGLFLVTPEQTLVLWINTDPFVRPHFSELVGALGVSHPARHRACRAIRSLNPGR